MLGVDPGTRFAGFGIIKKEKQEVQLIDYGCLRMIKMKNLVDRIGFFYEYFSKKIIGFDVTDIALETPFLGRNPATFLKLGYIRGILYLLASQNKLNVHEFSPSKVKNTVTGYGRASKEQVANMVSKFFPGIETDSDDTTDAIAVSLCGLWNV